MGKASKIKGFPYPTHDEIRQALLDRAAEFGRLTGKTPATIGKEAVNDGAFLTDVENDRNFTIKLYARFMDFLDTNWPAPPRRARSERKAA